MKIYYLIAMIIISFSVGCSGTSTSSSATNGTGTSGTTSGWVVVNSSGAVVAGTGFISNDLATGGATKGLTSGDFSVSFFDANNGWAVGNLGEILHTTDGATTVTRLGTSPTSSILRSVVPISATQVYVSGRDTTNGGSSIFYSSDSGATWTAQGNTASTYTGRSITITDRINALFFLSSKVGMAVGGLGDNTAIIWKTSDGSNWTQSYHGTPAGSQDQLQGIMMVNANVAYAVGNTGVIMKTSNGGTSWTVQTSGTTQNLFDVICSSALRCMVVGNGGTILATADGSTWSALTSGTTNDLSALTAADANNIWAGGASGTILYTADGGTTWTAQTSGTSYQIQEMFAVSSTNVWAVAASTSSNQGAILHTTTGGK